MKNKIVGLLVLSAGVLCFSLPVFGATNAMYVYAWDYSLSFAYYRDAGADLDLKWDETISTWYSLGLEAGSHWQTMQYFNSHGPDEVHYYYGWSTPTWPLTNNGVCTAEGWGDGWATDIHPCEDQPGPFNWYSPYEYCATYLDEWDWLYGPPVTGITTRNVNTEINFFTGGDPANTNVRPIFIKMQASAYDLIGSSNIPGGSLQVGGYQCDSSGAAYRSGVDNAYYGCTVAAMQNGFSNYNFNATPSKAYLKIFRGADVTDKTNTVFVGERVALTCKFVDANGDDSGIATITNFQWAVPGHKISNYVANSSIGLVLTNVVLTNASTYYYWVEGSGSNTFDVTCTIIVKGVSMSAKTTFNVIAPTANLISESLGPVVLDAVLGPTALHFGVTPNTPGVRFWGTNISAQFVTNGDWSFLQVVATSQKYNLTNGTSISYITNGLDTSLPYPLSLTITAPGFSIMTMDAPAGSLETSTAKCWRDDSFVMYLVFQSTRTTSIPIPIKQTEWHWGGVCTNVAGTWATGSLQSTNSGFGAVNTASSSLPEWIHNISNYRYTTNASWF